MEKSTDHPYQALPPSSFWKTAITKTELSDFDPVTNVPFRIAATDRVATAGSCFAQHISRALVAEGIRFLQTETADASENAGLPIYSARYGNIYTCRQLLQLFQRAYGLFVPLHTAWQRPDSRWVDPFRPNEFPLGFATVEEVEAETALHLAAVREMFESCDVLVFTLGLTEVWLGDDDGAAVPLPPGVVASPQDPFRTFSPTNLTAHQLAEDLLTFIDEMRLINPGVRFVITVSPVPIIATFEKRHVIVSNAYTKSALRIVADRVSSERCGVLYFPSYEMIVTHPKARYFDENFRAVRPEGVQAVMKVFRQRILATSSTDATEVRPTRDSPERPPQRAEDAGAMENEFKRVVCDEEMLAPMRAAS